MVLDRSTRILIEIVVAILAVGGLLAGAAVWRLSQAPVSLSFLTPQIESALSDAAQPIKVTLDDTVLAWSPERRALNVRAVGVHAYGSDGALIGTAPEISVSFSLRALLHGMVAPTRLELIGPTVRLARAEDGSISFGVAARGSEAEGTAPARLETLGSISDPSRSLGYLTHIRIADAELTVDDARTGARWVMPRATILLVREDGGLRMEFEGVAQVGSGLARVGASGTYRHEGDTIVLDANASGVDAAALATYHQVLQPLSSLRTTLSGNAHIVLSTDGSLRGLWFDVGAGSGTINPPGAADPLPLRSAMIHGAYVRDPDRLVIDRFEAMLDGPRVVATASAVRNGKVAEFQSNIQITAVPLAGLPRYWPADVASTPRRWVTANMTDGTVNDVKFAVAGSADLTGAADPQVKSVNGEMRLSGVTVHYLRPMPPVKNLNSEATFTIDNFAFNAKDGELGAVRIPEGKINIAGLNDPDQQLGLDLVIAGPVANVLGVLDHPRLNFMKPYGINPATSEGMSSSRLAMSFLLVNRLTFDEIELKMASNLVNAGIKGIAFGKDLSQGNLTVRADKKGMDVAGDAYIDGIPAKLRWLESFDSKAPVQRRYDVSGIVDGAAQKRLGLDMAPYATGPMAVQLSYLQPTYKAGEISAKIGLDDAVLTLPRLNWSKPAGTAAKAELVALFDSGKVSRISKFSVAGGGLETAGKIALDRAGKAAQIDVDRFALGETDVRVVLKRRDDGAFAVQAEGPSLDLRPVLARSNAANESADEAIAFAGTINFGKLTVGSGPPLSQLAGSLGYDGTVWKDVQVAGKLRGDHDIWAYLQTRDQGQVFELDAADAGEALRAFGVSDRVYSGNLHVNARRARPVTGEPWQGRIVMRDFSIADAPAIARAFAMSTGSAAPEAGTRAINFGLLEIPFVLKDDVVTVSDGRGVASNLGLTGSGTIDLAKETIELDGTLVPAYMLNSILGNIPILGTLLTGEKGSGVFAATYRAEGSLEDPKVSVNPLAALTPGFLRNIFNVFSGGQSGGVPSTTSEQPANN